MTSSLKRAARNLFFFAALGFGHSAHALIVKNKQVVLEKLDDYDQCQARDEDGMLCHDAMVRWVKAHPVDAFAAGQLTRAKMNHWAALPFFVQAFHEKKGNCKDEDVKLAVIGGLGLPADKKEIIAQAKELGFKTCAAEMKAAITEAMSDENVFKNSCKELAAKGELSGLRAKRCDNLK